MAGLICWWWIVTVKPPPQPSWHLLEYVCGLMFLLSLNQQRQGLESTLLTCLAEISINMNILPLLLAVQANCRCFSISFHRHSSSPLAVLEFTNTITNSWCELGLVNCDWFCLYLDNVLLHLITIVFYVGVSLLWQLF